MKSASCFFDDSGVPEPWAILAQALSFRPAQGAGWHERAALESQQPAPKTGKSWLERMDDWFARQRQREREAYLAQATDVFDLERRMRWLERSGDCWA